jgi:hypothetical protein
MRATVHGRMTLLDLLPRNSVGAEIGVFKGDFSAQIIRRVAPKRLYLIDPWRSVTTSSHRKALYGMDNRSQDDMDDLASQVAERFAAEIRSRRVKILRAPSSEALAAIPDESLDWIYIDGDHTFEGVLEDLRLSYQKVRKGGFICGDDYRLGNWFADGVVRGLHTFLAELGSAVVLVFVIDGQFFMRRL